MTLVIAVALIAVLIGVAIARLVPAKRRPAIYWWSVTVPFWIQLFYVIFHHWDDHLKRRLLGAFYDTVPTVIVWGIGVYVGIRLVERLSEKRQ